MNYSLNEEKGIQMLQTGFQSGRRIATFIGVTAVAGALMIAASPASASPASASETSSGGDGEVLTPNRVIDRTFENLPVDVTAQREAIKLQRPVEVRSAVPLPPGVTLSVGESVQVNYRNGVALHQAVSLGCTTSSTAGTPFSWGSYAESDDSHYVSSGCPSSQFIQAVMESYAWPW